MNSTIESKSKTRINRSTAKSTASRISTGQSKPDLQSCIEVAAYYKAQAREFAPGHELDDWLAAEKEVSQ